jgi:hypothetical protein
MKTLGACTVYHEAQAALRPLLANIQTQEQFDVLIVLGLETQTKPLYRLCMILDRLEEGCELVLALAVAPDVCEAMHDVTRVNARSCDVLPSTRCVRNMVRDETNAKYVPR